MSLNPQHGYLNPLQAPKLSIAASPTAPGQAASSCHTGVSGELRQAQHPTTTLQQGGGTRMLGWMHKGDSLLLSGEAIPC